MSHKTPVACEGGCCDADECEPGDEPVVTGTLVLDEFNYTVTNATFAEIRAWCPDVAIGPPDATYPVTLDIDGNATGSIVVDPECVYCIFASNDCGEAQACQDCGVPCCSIGVNDSSGTTPGVYTVNWSHYYFECPGGTDSPVASIAINGDPVTGSPGPLGSTVGSFTVNFADSPSEWCIRITNECGVASECCVQVPCCLRTTAIVLESSGFSSVHSRTCTWSTPDSGFGHGDIQETVVVNGLDGVNGTFILAPDSLTGNSYVDGLPGVCHDYTFPIPLGVYGSVEWRHTYTNVTSAVDACGDPWNGYEQKQYRIWTGEFALLLTAYGQQIVLIPSNKKQVTFKGWVGATCRYGALLPCAPGRTEWAEDSRYCIYDVSTPVGVHVTGLMTGGYGGYGACDPMLDCDVVTDFCYAQIVPYERTSVWGYAPAGSYIGCESGLGAIIRTCDNGIIGTDGCGAVGYGMQRRVYAIQI